MSFTLDMSKTYDRVECDYLVRSLVVLGFPPRIIHILMQCVKIASFSMLINGVPKGTPSPPSPPTYS